MAMAEAGVLTAVVAALKEHTACAAVVQSACEAIGVVCYPGESCGMEVCTQDLYIFRCSVLLLLAQMFALMFAHPFIHTFSRCENFGAQ